MKQWGLLVVFLYVLILTVLIVPLSKLCMWSPSSGNLGISWSDFKELIQSKEFLIFAGIALMAQAALLTVPVEMTAKRPITKRSIIPLMMATSFMMTVLMVGFTCAIAEVISEKSFSLLDPKQLLPVSIFLLIWLFWGFVFFKFNKSKDTTSLVQHLCGLLLKGSILELLIAVPSHIYVRQRTECCAGAMTFIGIAFGTAVMLFSFGPGVYFLFVNHCKQLSSKVQKA